MKFIVLFSLGFLVIPILKIFNIFIKFKFCHLYTTRIGHLTINFDVALLSVSENTILLCSHDKKIANRFILSFFKIQKKVFFLKIFRYLYHAIYSVNPNSNLIISWKQYQPSFSFHLKSKSRIKFPLYSETKLNNILSKYNINKNFVCLHSRDNLYVKKYAPNDKNFHDYRNFHFKDYELVIKYLKDKNNSIIKLGETFPEQILGLSEKDFYTSVDLNFNEETDYLLNAYSRYNIIGNSGVSGISNILRKKIIYVNLIPLNLDNLSYCSPGSLILPKKIFNKQKKRFLTFTENNNFNFNIHSNVDPYERNGLTVINNSPQEILAAVFEMENKLQGNNSYDSISLNDQFWGSITTSYNYEKINYLKNDLKLSIAGQFLKNNENLF